MKKSFFVIHFHLKAVSKSTSAISVLKSNYATKSEVTFDIPAFKLHRLDEGPATRSTLTAKEALSMYENLQMLRRLENACAKLYTEKVIRGFCHLYVGQEAIAIGMKSVMRPVDSLITSYRCHGWTYLFGVSVAAVIGELTGRKIGCSRGKGGSMHMYSVPCRFYGGNGIVGAQVPLGAGLAFASKYRGDGGVNFALYGDGAANQGQLYEAMNMAKLLKLPVAFVCENNQYGMGTSAERSSAATTYYTRGDYVPGIWVDGMDVLACREATKFTIDYCNKHGPLVLEMNTYRYFGHSMSDPGTSYRSRDEVQEVRKKRDPIALFRDKILQELVTADQLKEINNKVKKIVKKAVEEAKTAPEIPLKELTADIYYKNYEESIRGTYPHQVYKHIEIAERKL